METFIKLIPILGFALLTSCSSVEDAERLLPPALEPTLFKPPYSTDYEKGTSNRELRRKLESFALLREAGKMDINSTDLHGETALSKAIRLNDTDAVRDLLNQGADANNCRVAYNQEGLTMAAKHKNLKMVKLLIEHGARIDNEWDCYNTLTILAASLPPGNGEVIEYLISKGANVNAPFDDHMTSIFMAANDNRPILLKHGADINHRNISGRNALDYQLSSYADEPTEEWRFADIKFLLEHGINVNNRKGDKVTSLMNAVKTGNPKIVSLLLKYGGNPRLKDNEGKTAIDYIPKDSSHADELRTLLQTRVKR